MNEEDDLDAFEPYSSEWREALQQQITETQKKIDKLTAQVEHITYRVNGIVDELRKLRQHEYTGSSDQARDIMLAPYRYARRWIK